MAGLVSSLASLLKRTQIDDHDEVLSAAEGALKQNKNDVDAQHVKIVALLNLDRFQDAVKQFEAGGDKLKDRASLEYAYALYKTGKAKEAAQIASNGSGRGYQHVEAQARYRVEDFKRAAELYKPLSASLQDDAEADLRINVGAVNAQLEWSNHGHLVANKKPGREDLEAFETAYNAACSSIARGELGQGEVLLKRSVDLLNALDELTGDEKKSELQPIRVQQVYVLTKQGRTDEAQKLASSIEVGGIPDKSTRHIAQVNKVAASTTFENPFLVQRLVSRDVESLKPDFPFRYQSSILDQNRYATALQSQKLDGTIDSTASIISKQPAPTLDGYTNSLSVVNAAAHAKSATGKDGFKHVLPLLNKRPNDVGLALTIIQLYVLAGNASSAVQVLQSFDTRVEKDSPDVRYAPGLVGVAVSLYSILGRKSDVQSELAKAATYWRRRSRDGPEGVLHLLKAAGMSLIDSDNPDHQTLAKEIFTELHQADPNDKFAAAGLIAASPETADSKQQAQLTSIDRLIKGIDVDALETAGIAQPPNASTTNAASRKRPAEDSKPKKAKKIRKSKMPKDFDPNKKMDPERWLPLRDRSSYRPKGKKGKAKQALLSQGAAPAAQSDDSRPATPGGDVVKAKQSGGGANKKKKGKNKW